MLICLRLIWILDYLLMFLGNQMSVPFILMLHYDLVKWELLCFPTFQYYIKSPLDNLGWQSHSDDSSTGYDSRLVSNSPPLTSGTSCAPPLPSYRAATKSHAHTSLSSAIILSGNHTKIQKSRPFVRSCQISVVLLEGEQKDTIWVAYQEMFFVSAGKFFFFSLL